MGQVDKELAPWFKHHRFLAPCEIPQGESSLALLILWEVDHGFAYPFCNGSYSKLLGFTRRLKTRVAADLELREWVEVQHLQFSLSPGLPIRYHARWSVKIVKPAAQEPRRVGLRNSWPGGLKLWAL